jgi:hypothetical protein
VHRSPAPIGVAYASLVTWGHRCSCRHRGLCYLEAEWNRLSVIPPTICAPSGRCPEVSGTCMVTNVMPASSTAQCSVWSLPWFTLRWRAACGYLSLRHDTHHALQPVGVSTNPHVHTITVIQFEGMQLLVAGPGLPWLCKLICCLIQLCGLPRVHTTWSWGCLCTKAGGCSQMYGWIAR